MEVYFVYGNWKTLIKWLLYLSEILRGGQGVIIGELHVASYPMGVVIQQNPEEAFFFKFDLIMLTTLYI